jgi:hypothetical protein
VEELVLAAHRNAVAAWSVRVVLSQRRLLIRPESRTACSSALYISDSILSYDMTMWLPSRIITHVPVLPPLRQIRMIHPPVPANMLTGPDQHVL